MKLYKIKRGIGFNDEAYIVLPISGNMESWKFVSHLKNIIDKEKGFVGASLDTIITGVSGRIGFHKKKDYKYFMKKAKETFNKK